MRAVADEAFQQESQARLVVRFHMHAKQHQAKSLEAGRPVFEDVEYVELMVPGDKSNVVVRPVRPADKQRFRKQYEAFKAGQSETVEGTPLSEWPAIARSQVEELAHFRIRTVEQLAALSDSMLQGIGPIRALQAKARDFLERAKGNAPFEQMRAELSSRDNEIATLKQQLADVVKDLGEAKRRSSNKQQQA